MPVRLGLFKDIFEFFYDLEPLEVFYLNRTMGLGHFVNEEELSTVN